ncbi:MAG: PqqD family protein [Myxococcales bacterium]|nr:PqqD family protein [Myxococcales bacterium]
MNTPLSTPQDVATTAQHGRHRIGELAISDTGFVFDPQSGMTYTTNGTGLTILDGLRRSLGRDAILTSLAERFETSISDLHRDLDEFLHLLRRDGLVSADFRLPSSAPGASEVAS